MRVGFTELLVVFIVALFVVGPDKLPEYAKKLGEALAQLRKISDDATKDIKESIVEPLNEAQKPIREAMEPLENLNKAVQGNARDLKKSISDIGKAQSHPKESVESAQQPDSAEGAEKELKAETADPPAGQNAEPDPGSLEKPAADETENHG